MQTTCRNQDCLQRLVNSSFLIGYCRMGNGRSQREKNNKHLLSTKQNSKHFSCIVGSSRSSKLFKKYLAQIEHLLDMMEKWVLFSVILPLFYIDKNIFFAVPNWFHSSELHLWIIWHISCNSSDNSAQWKFQGPSLLTSRNINIWINCGF